MPDTAATQRALGPVTEMDTQIAEQTEGLPGDWTEIGWIPPDNLSRDAWMGVGPKLAGILDAIHWWVGDWIVYGEHKFGEAHAQAVDATNFEYNTVQKDAWVAKAIPYDQRRPELTYSHHRNLASSDISYTERVVLMNLAIQNEWTTKKTLAAKMEWIGRRDRLLEKAKEDGRMVMQGIADGLKNPLPSLSGLPENPTEEQVLEHIERMEQERREISIDLPRKRYRRGTGFPQVYDQSTGELSSAWRGIWTRICDDCRDMFMTLERDAWTQESRETLRKEEDSAEQGGQDSAT